MNPIFQKINQQKTMMPSIEDFKNRLAQMDDHFLDRMKVEARKRGISEQDIQKGLDLLNKIKR